MRTEIIIASAVVAIGSITAFFVVNTPAERPSESNIALRQNESKKQPKSEPEISLSSDNQTQSPKRLGDQGKGQLKTIISKKSRTKNAKPVIGPRSPVIPMSEAKPHPVPAGTQETNVAMAFKGGTRQSIDARISKLRGPSKGVQARRSRINKDRSARLGTGQRSSNRSQQMRKILTHGHPVIAQIHPSFGHKGQEASSKISLIVNNRSGPTNLTLIIIHAQELVAKSVSSDTVAQATGKQVILSSAAPGKTIIQIKGSEFAMSSGPLANIVFTVKNNAPAKSPIYISYVGVTGEPEVQIGTLGANMNIQ
jgi:hypothetical protein